MKITYTSVQHWKEAELILLTHDNAKLVAWPSSMWDNGFIIAIGKEE
jgi:hypothetical protein